MEVSGTDDKFSQQLKAWEDHVKTLPEYHNLLQANIDEAVVFEIINLIQLGVLQYEDLDEILCQAIRRLSRGQGVQFFKVLGQQDLSHVAKKGSYVCKQIKIFRYYIDRKETIFNKPDEAKVQQLLERTGYNIKVTTGSRIYGGPPPEWNGEPPKHREISISRLPGNWFEDKLVPVFEKFGRIYEMRLLIDNITGLTRNFCMLRYCDPDENDAAVRRLDGLLIETGDELKANLATCNTRLFIGNLPKTEPAEGFRQTFSQFVDGITKAEVFINDEMVLKGFKNKGYVFLTFTDHTTATQAKKILSGVGEKVYDHKKLKVEWCVPLHKPAPEESAKTKAVYVGNLSSEVNMDMLRAAFEAYGKLYHVERIRDYAFIHYEKREDAEIAIKEANGIELGGFKIRCNLSTSGPMQRKANRKNEKARLRGEFGYGKQKEKQFPSPPQKGWREQNWGRNWDHGGRSWGHGGYGSQRSGGGYGGHKRRYDNGGDGGYRSWGGKRARY